MTALQVTVRWRQLVHQLLTEDLPLFLAILVVLFGLVLGIVVARLIRRLLVSLDVPDAVEGTPFERTARGFGTSTVALLAQLSGLFVFAVAVILALRIVGLLTTQLFLARVADFLPQLFLAVVVVIVGLILGDKAELATSERLKGVKVAQIGAVPSMVKYSIFFVAGLVALAQLGVATAPLLILLAAYAFGLVFLGGLALKDLLASSAAGVYLLLTEPYSIGDEVKIDGKRGIVQEVDAFVTRVESDGEEFVIPNKQVFSSGFVLIRD